jgi:hypothetical protein
MLTKDATDLAGACKTYASSGWSASSKRLSCLPALLPGFEVFSSNTEHITPSADDIEVQDRDILTHLRWTQGFVEWS